jgi:hypothetical protein
MEWTINGSAKSAPKNQMEVNGTPIADHLYDGTGHGVDAIYVSPMG